MAGVEKYGSYKDCTTMKLMYIQRFNNLCKNINKY